jgi:REP element-mobilizing transposase RayT
MRQTSFFPPVVKEHGGILSVGVRRGRRVLSTRESLHLTLRSDFAKDSRSLLRHKDIVLHVMRKACARFRVRIYKFAICGNHLHFLLRGKSRTELQNFFRVLAGHIAQMILARCPLKIEEQRKLTTNGHPKNRRKFWALLTYTRIVTWGREFFKVSNYIEKNVLEALGRRAYEPRKTKRARAGP